MNNSDFFACNKKVSGLSQDEKSRYYKIVREIGRGGTSSVFLCTDSHIGKEWAMKLVSPEKGNTGSFTSEIETLKSLDYYMFPRITDAFRMEGRIAIITDYIEGENLESYLKREGPISESRALEYFRELLKALMYLHNRDPGILYLDMKPSNIMITKTGELRLIDFGIASSVLTKGHCYGSPGYAAPEQYEKGRILTPKADVYALGMTLYSMLTASAPGVRNAVRIRKEIRNLITACTKEREEDRPGIEELLLYLERLGRRKKSIGTIVLTAALTVAGFVYVLRFVMGQYRNRQYEEYARQMIMEVSKLTDGGEYTVEGIRVICGYIDGNYLDEETKERFSYEVARFYFEEQKDYSLAKHYFSFMNKNEYPEAAYYERLCRYMSEFNSDIEGARYCLDSLVAITERLPEGRRKDNNNELIEFIREEIKRRTT